MRKELTLPQAPKAGGSYSVVKEFGSCFLYVSGCGPVIEDKGWSGRLGEEYTTEEGRKAAENCTLNLLSAVNSALGTLTRVKSVVKLLVFVAGGPTYGEQSVVANGATDLLVSVFGTQAGSPARSAIGVNSLPNHIPVEIEAIFEIQPDM